MLKCQQCNNKELRKYLQILALNVRCLWGDMWRKLPYLSYYRDFFFSPDFYTTTNRTSTRFLLCSLRPGSFHRVQSSTLFHYWRWGAVLPCILARPTAVCRGNIWIPVVQSSPWEGSTSACTGKETLCTAQQQAASLQLVHRLEVILWRHCHCTVLRA
jgi:hypothetical protein